MPKGSSHKAPRRRRGGNGAVEVPEGAEGRICDVKGCTEEGRHRAPFSPGQLETYYWFCLEHVREYNKAWNYCAGRSEAEIEAMIREDTVGWRPTWPLGRLGGGFAHARFDRMRDGFGLFDEDRRAARDRGNGTGGGRRKSAVDAALDILDLSPPVTVARVRAQYKVLVKRHHPDANGGDKAAEERLKLINRAYETIRESLDA